jgi:hypothetical protein
VSSCEVSHNPLKNILRENPDTSPGTGRPFERSSYTEESLQDVLTYARAVGDTTRERRIIHLIVTAEGRYDFGNVNLNSLVSVTPQRFREWLAHAWASTP